MTNNIITTKSIANGIAEVGEDFILCEEKMSRIVFQAQIHSGGIRGKIVRQRRESATDVWVPEKAIDIRTLGKNETINLTMDTASVFAFYSAIKKLASIINESGIQYGEQEYAVVDPKSIVITDENKIEYIKKVIDAGYPEDVWISLAESNPTLVSKLAHAKIQEEKEKVVHELEERLLSGSFSETIGDDSWQKWIYKNNWLFGVNYLEPIEKAKINLTGVMPDYLFPTVDGFVDILEIKLPSDEVIKEDASHPGSWIWTKESNKAVGQVVNYLGEVADFRVHIQNAIRTKYSLDVSLLKPRAYILIGNSSNWSIPKKEGLRKLNHALHGIEVITYNDLLIRGKQFLNAVIC